MSEFYTHLSEDEIKRLLARKMHIYDEKIRPWPAHRVLMEPGDFVYRYYAKFHDKVPGTFELFRYIGMWEGTEIYHFYVEQPCTEESANMRKERKIASIESRHEYRCKRKFEGMKVSELNSELKKRRLPADGKKDKKVDVLARYELAKIVAAEMGEESDGQK